MKKLLGILVLGLLVCNNSFANAKIIFRNCKLTPNVFEGTFFTIDLEKGQVIEERPGGEINLWKIDKIVDKSVTTQEPIFLAGFSDHEFAKYKRNFIWMYTFNLADNTVSHSLELYSDADPAIKQMTKIGIQNGKLVHNVSSTCDVENLIDNERKEEFEKAKKKVLEDED